MLWHPDMHANNIIVSKPGIKPCRLRGVIDWQGASVSPDFLEVKVPDAYDAPEPLTHPLVHFDRDSHIRPDFKSDVDLDAIDPVDKRLAELNIRSIERTSLYQQWLRDRDPELFEAFWGEKSTADMLQATAPLFTITSADIWGLGCVRAGFQQAYEGWSLLVGEDDNGYPLVPYPLPAPELDEKYVEMQKMQQDANEACEFVLRDKFNLHQVVNASIDVELFDEVEETLDRLKQTVIDESDSMTQQELDAFREEVWPIREGKLSFATETCY
ncbi:hypothetical protein NMY22_g12745 [Coprinellus aureogranulatus]|nr:hypothetical protein NMY22_g12745 [Coprinellus aureogranulatus]